MSTSIPQLEPIQSRRRPVSHEPTVPSSRPSEEGMTDWAWIANRIGDCDPGQRMQESAVQRRNEALASAEQVMGLRQHAE